MMDENEEWEMHITGNNNIIRVLKNTILRCNIFINLKIIKK